MEHVARGRMLLSMGNARTRQLSRHSPLLLLLACCVASDPSVEVTQYVRTAWTSPDGFFLGNIYAMAQRPEGNLWFGGESGLFRFDGIRRSPWQAPAGQHLPDKNIYGLTTKTGFPGERERRSDSAPRHFYDMETQGGLARLTKRPQIHHLTTNDGLSQSNVKRILQDRRGFLWFATRDGLNRYVGYLERSGRRHRSSIDSSSRYRL
jgi:ligand-binding sensor domain-containing protein